MATTQGRRTGARTVTASSKVPPTSTSAPDSQSTSERLRHDVVTADAPLTTRGARRSRREGGGSQGPGRKETDNGTTASTHHHFAGRGAPWISDEADGDVEVETPRRERVEAVVIPAWTKKWKPTDLGEQEKRPQLLDMETVHKSLPSSLIEVSAAANFPTMTVTTTMTTDAMTSDTPMEILSDTEISQEKSIQNQRDPFGLNRDLGKSLFFEDLSLSPPPPPLVFDGEEDALGELNEESRWMMVFDSEHRSAKDAPRRIIPDLEHTRLEDGHDGEDHDLSTVSDTWRQKEDQERGGDDDVEDDDDPFGFFKVERQLQRTKNLRPKLLAINEVHHHPIATAVLSKNSNNSTSSGSKDTDHGSVSVSDQGFRERLDQSVLRRAANRKRGEGKGKDKAIDRESSSSSSHLGHEADRSQSNTTTDPMDEDLQKAIRLSRGLDIEIGEGSSSFEKPSSALSRYNPDVTNDMTLGLSADPALNDLDEEEPLTRNNRRISRQYGRVASIDVDADTNIGAATKAQSTSQTTTTDNATWTRDLQLSRQAVVESDHDDPDEAFRPLSPSPPARKVPDQKRLSFGSDDFPPILIETTPKKKPEAGMPLSMDLSPPPSPSTRMNKSRGRMSKKSSHKPLLTEQLEALLPQRRLKREPLGSKNKRVGRTKGRRDAVMIESSDEESDDEEDHSKRVHGNKGKKKGVADARHQNRPTTKQKPSLSSSVRDTAPSGKKRRAPADAESYTPVPKRSHVQKSTDADLSSKSKERHQADLSGWSASQFAAQKERIKYFQQVDDFELEVETV